MSRRAIREDPKQHSHPGNMPVSNTPKKNRAVIRPPQVETSPWQIITRPNMNMQNDTVERRGSVTHLQI